MGVIKGISFSGELGVWSLDSLDSDLTEENKGIRYHANQKKRRTSLFNNKTDKKKQFELISVESYLKIFKKSFILDQSQVCISNGLEARALQREALFC